ncbi:MAG: hypothetical protein OEM62_05075 [Acidobacteriota bacterium]|nr:hypothetical protein [Acidobacteriota bacterium]
MNVTYAERGLSGDIRWLGWAAWAVFLMLFVWQGREVLTARSLRADEPQFVNCAVNLLERGVFSGDTPRDGEIHPTAYREPAYPFFLALAMHLFHWGAVTTPSGYLLLKIAQYALVLVAALAGGEVGRMLGGTSFQVWLIRVGIAFSPALVSRADHFDSGNVAAALLPLIALASLRLLKLKSLRLAVLVGGLAATLALTRAAFLYLIPGLSLVLWLGLGFRAPEARRKSAVAALAFLGVALVPAAVWMSRNYLHFGHFVMSDRGGVVLTVRAEFDRDLDRDEFLAAVLSWTPSGPAQTAAARYFPEARVARMSWTSSDNYFVRAIQRWEFLRSEGQPPLEVDRSLKREAITRFLRTPGRHLLASIPVGWRGLFIEQDPEPLRWLNLAVAVNLLFAAALALLTLRALLRWDPRHFVVVTLALFPLLFHTLLTENLPRFNEPVLPLLWVALVMAPQAWSDLRST